MKDFLGTELKVNDEVLYIGSNVFFSGYVEKINGKIIQVDNGIVEPKRIISLNNFNQEIKSHRAASDIIGNYLSENDYVFVPFDGEIIIKRIELLKMYFFLDSEQNSWAYNNSLSANSFKETHPELFL